ncbi:SAP domain [Pyrenophora seminiperda CCB06]|uniref:SAP domain n=1 Tax=Pyrenophora seminiperda CCB06 TaxID=1302712 RepID=A0A3M7M0H6_9PLEO|nr:SAP domain [Pyrenophora seminiperda CCB06]
MHTAHGPSQEHNCICNLLRLSQAVCRYTFAHKVPDESLGLLRRLDERRRNVSRAEGIDADLLWRIQYALGAGQTKHSVTTRYIRTSSNLWWGSSEGMYRANMDDAATAISQIAWFLLQHLPQLGSMPEPQTCDMVFEISFECGGWGGGTATHGPTEAGIVDGEIDAPEARCRLLDHSLDRLLGATFGGNAQHVCYLVLRCQCLDCFLQPGFVGVYKGKLADAMLGQRVAHVRRASGSSCDYPSFVATTTAPSHGTMTDYSKQTVAQLRQLLKDRSIPSTGLTRKAQIIEKLEEADAPPDAVQVDKAEDEADEEAGARSSAEPDAELTRETEPELDPVPATTADALPETISPMHSEGPRPDEIKAIEALAEDGATTEEPGSIQAGAQMKDELAQGELPDAPGPTADASHLAPPSSELPEDVQNNGKDEKASSPAPNEKQSVEKPELLAIREQSTAETSRLNTEELEADSRKRKRRSDTPEMAADEIKAKKHRPSQEPAPEVYLKEDDDIVMDQRRPDDEEAAAADAEEHSHATPVPIGPPSPTVETDTKREKKENSARYKDLVDSRPDNMPLEALTDDRPTIPALHPVTHALYIRNFMRPLRPEPLRAHLVSLASPPSASPDPTIVKSLFLDAMKTHAIVLFSSTTAASRVRASLHGSIWPPEGNRKELWVDFIPEENVEAWIKQEEDAIAAEKEARANVSDEISELRLKELDAETSRDWAPGEVRKGRGIKIEMKYKYSFDEDDRIVEIGEDRGPWSEGFRGGRGGFRGRGRGGGFRGRGDNWRG